jgi:Holliday junction resolvase RusA-like endonuclease
LNKKEEVVISLENVSLVSINQKYTMSRGRMILSQRYRDFKTLLEMSCREIQMPGPYCVSIYVSTYLDADNIVKCTLDVLKGRVIDDDKNVLQLFVYKNKIKRNELGSLIVIVETI